MGACKEAVYNTVERDLKKVYRAEAGWSLERCSESVDVPTYMLTQKRPGKKVRVLVQVYVVAAVGAEEFDRVRKMAVRYTEQGMPVSRTMLVVPQNIALSADAGDITLFSLPSYSVRNGEVIWSKSTLWTAEGKPVLEKP